MKASINKIPGLMIESSSHRHDEPMIANAVSTQRGGMPQMSNPKLEVVKAVGDGVAATTTLGTLMSLIPPIVAVVTLAWTIMRMYEMYTGLPFHKTPLMKKFRGDE